MSAALKIFCPVFPAQLILEFERSFKTVTVGKASALSQTGEEYIAFLEKIRFRSYTVEIQEELAETILKSMTSYALGKGPHLYWRLKPEFGFSRRKIPELAAYTRLLVSEIGPT